MAEQISVEVVYVLPDKAHRVTLQLAPGSTIGQAIEASGLLERCPEIDLDRNNRVGVFGRLRHLNDRLADGDRVEIYRPLRADPKEARRRRAAKRTRG